MQKKFIFIFLGIVLLLAVGYCGYRYVQLRNARFDAMCVVEHELGVMERDEVTADFVHIGYHTYEDGLLTVYVRLNVPEECPIKFNLDSISREFLCLTAIYPEGWDAIIKQLVIADISMQLCYNGYEVKHSVRMSPDEMNHLFDNSSDVAEAKEIFAQRKLMEVKDYALRHFKYDAYLRLKDVHLEPDYVALTLEYDDSKYQLSPSLCDTSRIANHFIDKVDTMGSIVDNMLQICLRTDRGIAIEYEGKQKGTFHRCNYNVSKTHQMVEELQHYQIYDDRRENVVSTGSYTVRE